MKKLILKTPSTDDFLRLFAAWRVWLAGAIVGAAIASLIYLLFPPAYRAQATVLVDQHVEQVIPVESTDLLKYTFLQRETDKLYAIAMSDQTLGQVAAESGVPVAQLRGGRLQLSPPGDGSWHFFADATNPDQATQLASGWAKAFVDVVQSKPAGINPLLEVNYTQQQNLPVGRTISMGTYIFCGALLGVCLLAILLLFVDLQRT